MILAFQTTITEKGQTTVPAKLRTALGLSKGDRMEFAQNERGEWVVRRAQEEGDPALAPFLELLARDMVERPAALAPLDPDLLSRARELTRGVEVDLDEPLEPEDD